MNFLLLVTRAIYGVHVRCSKSATKESSCVWYPCSRERGGFDIGLERAGFETIAATDVDADCIATLRASQQATISSTRGRTFLQGTRIVEADVAGLSISDLCDGETPDLLAGGPPCQPFSSAGKQVGLDDPRGRLWEEFLRIADEMRPRMIVLENVRGLVTARGPSDRPGEAVALVREAFEALGYGTAFALLNSADYGAPQRRIRLFMIASRVSPLPGFPDPTNARPSGDPSLLPSTAPWRPLRKVLTQVGPPEPDEIVRPRGKIGRQLDDLEPGTGIKAGGIIEANRPGGHWGYRQDGFLADLDLPARTIRAASTPDWIRVAEGDHRRLTWRECAALQGFPAEWEWRGSVTSRFRQIGNAVQTAVAEAIGRSVIKALEEASCEAPKSRPWPANFQRAIAYTSMEQRANGEARESRVRALI
jgi:DNA (cytosine-5)-methyltransferase 1